jgi:4-hydroxybenzoate polyprenyltransferase
MPASQAVRHDAYVPSLTPTVTAVPHVAPRSHPLGALVWAVLTSTGHRIRRGEGALLAINLSLILLSLIVHAAPDLARGVMQAAVSTLAILVMYAFNDLYDAPVDWNNPKKDRRLIATWIAHRRAGVMMTSVLMVVTLALAFAVLGARPAAAVAAVMVVNVVYSTRLKGVPVADVLAVWVWGALYAAIVGASVALAFLVGLMTGICHLFQALDDRAPDAANGIETTAVRSAVLARDVLIGLSLVLGATLYGPLGIVGAASAFVPLAIFFMVADAGAGWLLTKGYFAVVWLAVLGAGAAAG